ncbi:MAG: hypothetical protein ITG00_10630 [Flavobacterium sp.]|nr:hypothetical protein [Flavobacterium sp.]
MKRTIATITHQLPNLFRTVGVIVCFMFTSGMHAQQKPLTETAPETKESSVYSKMEMLFWFTGTKQAKTSNGFDDEDVDSRKKQIIMSGTMPNRILSRTFMNKALNYGSTIT